MSYSDKLLKITELIDDYAVAGSISGMNMPVVGGFQGGQTKSWVGGQDDVLEDIFRTRSTIGEVYEF